MLVNQIFDGAAWVDANNRLVNIVGTPIASVALNSDGQQLSDEYTLTFDTVVAGVSANATIVSLSPNNPYRATKAVLLDGATVHKNVIPGYDIVFSNAGGFLATWSSTIKAGQFGGTFDASGIGAGVPSAGVRQRAYNAGTGADSGCLAGLRTMIKEYKKVGSVFSKTENFAPNAVEKTAGGGSSRVMPYVLTITNTAGAGAGKTCDLSVDGVVFAAATILDINGGANVSGVGLKAIAGQKYRVRAGHNLADFEFAIDPACANGDTANIMVFPSRYRRVGPDAGGVQGAMGAADIVLTQAGQAAGTILAGGFAFYWADFLVPAGANPESNPYPTDVYVAGTVTGAAGWAT
jgi:hypothetical protein